MGLFSFGRGSQKKLFKSFDGRSVRYVTRRVESGGTVRDEIIGKNGRIVVKDDIVKVICETDDVFCCRADKVSANLLLSGNGVMLQGENSVTGNPDNIIVYYSRM